MSLPLHIHPLLLWVPHKNKQQTNTENQKVKTNKQYLTLEAVVCRTIYTFAPTALLVNVYCSKSLVWFEASGLHYAPSILNPQWDSSWISSCCSVSWRFLQLWFCRTSPFTCSALNRWGRSSDVITLMSWIWPWMYMIRSAYQFHCTSSPTVPRRGVGSSFLPATASKGWKLCPCTHHAGAISFVPIPPCSALSCCPGEAQGQLSCMLPLASDSSNLFLYYIISNMTILDYSS